MNSRSTMNWIFSETLAQALTLSVNHFTDSTISLTQLLNGNLATILTPKIFLYLP